MIAAVWGLETMVQAKITSNELIDDRSRMGFGNYGSGQDNQ